MRSKNNKTNREATVLDFLRTGGKKAPADLRSQRMAAVKRSIKAGFEQTSGIQQQTAKFWGKVQKASNPIGDAPATKNALDGLLGIHKKLANKKLIAPRVAGELGGLLPGRISAKITAPFDYAFTIPTVIYGNPILTGSANTNGQISASAVTAMQGRNFGSMYSEVGIYFHPLAGGSLRVSASPSFSIEWWTNSLNAQSPVTSSGQGDLAVYSLDPIGGVSGGPGASLDEWDERTTQQILFDFGSNPQLPVSVQLDVNPSLTYLLFVSIFVLVEGVGWPGSLAGAVMSVTLPSLTYELDIREVLSSGAA